MSLNAKTWPELKKQLKSIEGKAIFKLKRNNSMNDGEFIINKNNKKMEVLKMEEIKFRVIVNGDMCRIEARDIRREIRNIAGGGCICSLDVMLGEMQRINADAEKAGFHAVFIMD